MDAGSGLVHTVGAAANVNDVVIACALVRQDGPFCHAGSGCTGTGDSPRVASGLAGVGRSMPENALSGHVGGAPGREKASLGGPPGAA